MKIRFETCEFERSHGRAPRGRGSWVFEVQCTSQTQIDCLTAPDRQGLVRAEQVAVDSVQLSTRGGTSYLEAKAILKLALRGHFTEADVTVCP